VKEVLMDQGLWQQGVRFGFNFNKDETRYWISIHPGHSGLTHQQVLNRLLGRAHENHSGCSTDLNTIHVVHGAS
jgi:hypothetical protein